MTDLTPASAGALLGWGTLVGLDLVSLPQMMISRPIVAGLVAGFLVGDPRFGVVVGVLLELFAMESVAIGAARYPDYGAATVGAVVAGAGTPENSMTGLAVIMGLVLASFGGWTLMRLRHANATAVRRREASLTTGDPAAVRALQFGGLARDVVRSAVLACLALFAGLALRAAPALPDRGSKILLVVVAGGALAGAASGAIRTAGRGRRLRWFGWGLLAGSLVLLATW